MLPGIEAIAGLMAPKISLSGFAAPSSLRQKAISSSKAATRV
jgi:hypothetical protein